jgi:sugar/nucleoside kinase (ribokinase family)
MVPSAAFVGLTTLDLIYSVATYPTENKKIVARRQGMYAGGPATNAAAAFASLGGRSRLISAQGQTAASYMILDDLSKLLVEIVDLAGDDFVPSISSIVVSEATGSRTVVSTNATTTAPQGSGFRPAMLDDVALVLVDGHNLDLCMEAAQCASAAGIHVVFDGGSWKTGTENLLRHVDTAICSEDFVPPHLTAPSVDTILSYLSQFVRRAAVTRGARPVLFREGPLHGEVPVPRAEVVDTLGAGDIYHGAFCYYHLTKPGQPFAELLAEAAQVASLSCAYFGPREWATQYHRARTSAPEGGSGDRSDYVVPLEPRQSPGTPPERGGLRH